MANSLQVKQNSRFPVHYLSPNMSCDINNLADAKYRTETPYTPWVCCSRFVLFILVNNTCLYVSCCTLWCPLRLTC